MILRGRILRPLLALGLLATATLTASVADQKPASAFGKVKFTGLSLDQVVSEPSPHMAVATAFDPQGRIYVAEKPGVVQVFAGAGDPSPKVSIDISNEVHSYWDRGLLGMTVDDDFNASPYLYVLYTYNKDPFAAAVPAYPPESCPPGFTSDPKNSIDGSCTVTVRISRFQLDPATGVATSGEEVLVQTSSTSGWCEQFPSHSVGALLFGPDHKLYATAGEGASFNRDDIGRLDHTAPAGVFNPCGDPPGSRGDITGMSDSKSEGGSFRAQAVRRTVRNGYTPLDGALLRMEKDGSAPIDNPLVGNSVPGDDRIIAFGFRNPYRFGFKPGSNPAEIWVGDVGLSNWEEIDRFTFDSAVAYNAGWPCYEGPTPLTGGYLFGQNELCTSMYSGGPLEPVAGVADKARVLTPLLPLNHLEHIKEADGCIFSPGSVATGSAVTAGVFIPNDLSWPADLRGAYVFGDFARQCVWAIKAADLNNPTVEKMVTLASGISVVDIKNGPGGAIYLSEPLQQPTENSNRAYGGGTVWRLGPGNPIAAFTFVPSSGPAPLTVTFNASQSSAVSPATLSTYEWDLTGSGIFTAGGPTATLTYASDGPVTVRLRVTDSQGRSSISSQRIQIGAVPVINSITTSADGNGWAVGDTISYSADVSNPGARTLSYRWNVLLRHCPADGNGVDCHEHGSVVGALPDAASGSFVAPDHAWRTDLRLELTVTDSVGLSATKSVVVNGRPVSFDVNSDPSGIAGSLGDQPRTTPFSGKAVEHGSAPVSLPWTTNIGGKDYVFGSWDDDPLAGPSRSLNTRNTSSFMARYSVPSSFTPITPKRVLDTRDGTGGRTGKLGVDEAMSIDLVTPGIVPAGTTAVLMNLTVTEPDDAGYAEAYPCDSARPFASNVNFSKGQTVPNLTQVQLSADGKVCLFTHVPSHLVADVAGFYGPGGSNFQPVDPERVLDTREGLGAPKAPLPAYGIVDLDLSGKAPAGATAVMFNLTGTNVLADGYVTAYPCGDRPLASNLNVPRLDTRPNLVAVPLSATGHVCLFAQSPLDLVADLAGWYGPSGSKVMTFAPRRLLDSRENVGLTGPVPASTTVELDLSTFAPPGATGAVLNLTSVGPVDDGFVVAYPCGTPPLASNLNVLKGDTRPNMVSVRLSSTGKVCLMSQQQTQLVADIAGWIL